MGFENSADVSENSSLKWNQIKCQNVKKKNRTNFLSLLIQETTEVKTEIKSSEQDDETNIDLDTRIAMMFKEKSFGAAPPFLQLDSDSETEKEDRPTDDTEISAIDKIKLEINSTENSMHGAGEANSNDSSALLKAKVEIVKKCIEDGASDISSDDEVLESCTPPTTQVGDIKLEDDKMSLSSLSSTEEKVNRKPAETDMSMYKNAVSQVTDYYYPSGANPYYYPPNGDNATFDPYSSHYMSTSQGYMQPYMPGFPAIIPGGYVQSTEYPERKDEPIAYKPEPKKDPSEQTVAAVIERVKTELQQILKRDIKKRMIESIAYKKYDQWWDEQVQMHQNKNKPSTTTA